MIPGRLLSGPRHNGRTAMCQASLFAQRTAPLRAGRAGDPYHGSLSRSPETPNPPSRATHAPSTPVATGPAHPGRAPLSGPSLLAQTTNSKPELFAHAHATLTDPQCQKRPTRGAGAQTGCDCGGAAAPRPALRVGPRMCGRRMGQTPRARSPRQCQSPSRHRLSANRSG